MGEYCVAVRWMMNDVGLNKLRVRWVWTVPPVHVFRFDPFGNPASARSALANTSSSSSSSSYPHYHFTNVVLETLLDPKPLERVRAPSFTIMRYDGWLLDWVITFIV